MADSARYLIAMAALTCLVAAGQTQDARAHTHQPPGDEKSVKTRVLELGAKVLQGNSPPGLMDVYLVGFKLRKDLACLEHR